ncbi:MAG TPA: GDSL-type esterase/lipase family protein [Verrucomicrobiae bacterium]|nr:GDSL-type esterase/lipase family protein [Verrucomicrobiae bacterium]
MHHLSNLRSFFRRHLAQGLLGVTFIVSFPLASAQTETPLPAPVIHSSSRGKDKGVVILKNPAADTVIRYTLDGTEPNKNSGPYLAPIALPFGGTVKARAFSQDRKRSSVTVASTIAATRPGTPPPNTLVPVTQDRDFPIYDWATRHNAVRAQVKTRKPRLIFVGDSITQMFGGEPHDRTQPGRAVWEKFYGHRQAANLGFGYDFVENTLWRLQHGELDGAKAKVAVVLIGTNNSGKNTAEEIATGVRAICDELRSRQRGVKILLLGILPRSAKPDAGRAKVAEVNKLLAKFDGRNGVTYLDLWHKFLAPDGSISREIMSDFLHPTERGYQIWAEAMEPTLAKMLGEK